MLFRGALSSLQKQFAVVAAASSASSGGATKPAATSSSASTAAAVVLVTASFCGSESSSSDERHARRTAASRLDDGETNGDDDRYLTALAGARGGATFPPSSFASSSRWRARVGNHDNNGVALCQAAAKSNHDGLRQLQSLAAPKRPDVSAAAEAAKTATTKKGGGGASKRPYGIDVVLGSQWGDEGKGKLVDILSQVSSY